MIKIQPRTWRRIVTVCAVAWGAWWFYSERIIPLNTRADETARTAAELRDRVKEARNELEALDDMELQTDAARQQVVRLHSDLPKGSPVAWFPPRLTSHFERAGVSAAVTRLISNQEVPDMPGLRRIYWSVALPVESGNRNVTGLLFAVSDFEQQNRFARIMDFSIRPDAADGQRYAAAVSVVALVPE